MANNEQADLVIIDDICDQAVDCNVDYAKMMNDSISVMGQNGCIAISGTKFRNSPTTLVDYLSKPALTELPA